MSRLMDMARVAAVTTARELAFAAAVMFFAVIGLAAFMWPVFGAPPLGANPPAVAATALPNEPPAVADFCPCRASGVPCVCAGGCSCATPAGSPTRVLAHPAASPALAPVGQPVTVCGPNGCRTVYYYSR